jgi:hypothetical protein
MKSEKGSIVLIAEISSLKICNAGAVSEPSALRALGQNPLFQYSIIPIVSEAN